VSALVEPGRRALLAREPDNPLARGCGEFTTRPAGRRSPPATRPQPLGSSSRTSAAGASRSSHAARALGERHRLALRDPTQEKESAMDTRGNPPVTDAAIRRYAAKFYIETAASATLGEPTDANLAAILDTGPRPPSADSYDAIRRVLADLYEVTLSPASIVLKAAEEHADHIEARRHDDATIAEGESIRAAAAQVRGTRGLDVGLLCEQRDWLLSLHAENPTELGRTIKAGTRHLDGLVNLLETLLDSAEGYALPPQVS